MKHKNEDNTSENTQIIHNYKRDRTIKFRYLNSYLTAGNSNWWPRVLYYTEPIIHSLYSKIALRYLNVSYRNESIVSV